MSREWNVGDRFTLEFEVTGWSGEWTECKTIGAMRRAFPPSDMQHAKLIEPAAPEPQKLDVTQPMRRKGTENERLHYLHENPLGQIYCTDASGYVAWAFPDDLENIPEPKIKGIRRAILSGDGGIYWEDSWRSNLQIKGYAWVEITEGDGMEES